MQKLVFVLMLALGSTSFANVSLADSGTTPILVKKVGGNAHVGTATTCEIYSNHPKIAPQLKHIEDLIRKARQKGEMEVLALFAQAQIPSVEIYAHRIATPRDNNRANSNAVSIQKIQLEEIYGSHRARKSEEASALIKLVNELCK